MSDRRVEASLQRLLRPDYEPGRVLAHGVSDTWPGDLPGRLLLSLAALGRWSGSPPDRLAELVDRLPAHLNERGYLGEVLEEVDEQQVAGHSWLVSGLLAAGRLTADGRPSVLAGRIMDSLLLPAVRALGSYPVRSGRDSTTGAASGSGLESRNGWSLSTDTYCILIVLEALVASYESDPDERVAEAVGTVLGLVQRIDLRESGAQLHASLTAGRCLMRWHELTGDESALAIAAGIFEDYSGHARAPGGAPWNWFGRPDSWTEPCAQVDALVLALGLWRALGDPAYLEAADSLEHSALARAQRPDGSFGLDTLPDVGSPQLRSVEADAWWCCTMRGALGLVEAREHDVRVAAGRVWVDRYREGTSEPLEGVSIVQRTAYPASGQVQIEIVAAAAPVPLTLNIPSWAQRHSRITLNGRPAMASLLVRKGDRIVLDLPMGRRVVPDAGGCTVWVGPRLHARTPAGWVAVGDVFDWAPAEAAGFSGVVVLPGDTDPL